MTNAEGFLQCQGLLPEKIRVRPLYAQFLIRLGRESFTNGEHILKAPTFNILAFTIALISGKTCYSINHEYIKNNGAIETTKEHNQNGEEFSTSVRTLGSI